jgi:CBS domain-containing protein
LLNAGKKAEKAGMPGFQVICLNERATVFTAIQSMALAGSRCLAIVDDDGNLSGNFSVSDLSFVFFSKVNLARNAGSFFNARIV